MFPWSGFPWSAVSSLSFKFYFQCYRFSFFCCTLAFFGHFPLSVIHICNMLYDDVDSGQRGPCVVAVTNKFTWTAEVLWRTRDGMAPLWVREGPDPWVGFYCFSGYITSRIVLIYYAQVRFRWLLFTDNKGEEVANYYKEKGYLQMQRKKWLNWLHSILGRFSADFRKLFQICSKHLLPQFRVREFYQKASLKIA